MLYYCKSKHELSNLFFVFVFNKSKWDILLKREEIHPAQGVLKWWIHQSLIQINRHLPRLPAPKEKRKVNNYMIPIQGSGYLHQSCKLNERGTPLDESHKKRIQLHLFNNTERIKNHIFEHAIISLLLDCSNTSQPNNL